MRDFVIYSNEDTWGDSRHREGASQTLIGVSVCRAGARVEGVKRAKGGWS